MRVSPGDRLTEDENVRPGRLAVVNWVFTGKSPATTAPVIGTISWNPASGAGTPPVLTNMHLSAAGVGHPSQRMNCQPGEGVAVSMICAGPMGKQLAPIWMHGTD